MKCYIDYKFIGVHSFTGTLDDSGTSYRMFEDDYSLIYEKHSDLINADDSIRTGLITKDEQGAFFTEFGIKITAKYFSHIVFIFDHHPSLEEIISITFDLEGIINDNLDNVDLTMFAEKISKK